MTTKKKQKYPQPINQDDVKISKSSDKIKPKTIILKNKITGRTFGQEMYINSINESLITLCSGPAGCGKTWIATGLALKELLNNSVSRIVVSKPIIEAGDQSLGYLPGEIDDKILPYFQAILDCFEDHIGPTMLKRLIDGGKIIFLPTAFARGADIKNSFILIDEAQNLTKKGIKLMLSRISENSKMVLNGDTDQIDLPHPRDSGMEWAMRCLVGKSSSISVIELSQSDIQRHPIISLILSSLRDNPIERREPIERENIYSKLNGFPRNISYEMDERTVAQRVLR